MKRTARVMDRLVADGATLDVSGELVLQSAELLEISPPSRRSLAAETDAF
jgi:hypothetical protein